MSTKIARRLLGRRRTGGIAVAVVSVLVLGGCAANTHPGAAAVVGDTEISVQELDKTSRSVGDALGQPFGSSAALTFMVRNALVAQVVEQRAVTVTDAETDAAMKAALNSQEAYDRFLKDPVASEFLREVARSNVGTLKLGGGSLTGGNADQATQAGTKVVMDASKNIPVQISPRFGKWTDGNLDVTVSGSLSEESARTKADREQTQKQQQEQQQQG